MRVLDPWIELLVGGGRRRAERAARVGWHHLNHLHRRRWRRAGDGRWGVAGVPVFGAVLREALSEHRFGRPRFVFDRARRRAQHLHDRDHHDENRDNQWYETPPSPPTRSRRPPSRSLVPTGRTRRPVNTGSPVDPARAVGIEEPDRSVGRALPSDSPVLGFFVRLRPLAHFRSRESRLSARGLPPVWHFGQYCIDLVENETSRIVSPHTGHGCPARP